MATQPHEQASQTKAVGQTTEASLTTADQFTADQFMARVAEMKSLMMPDMDAVMATHRRNMDAISAASRVEFEGAQSLARRNMEILQQTMTELADAAKALAAVQTPTAKAAKQAELLKAAYQHAVDNMKELRDLIHKINAEALGLLNTRFSEGLEEIQALIEKAGETREH